MDCGELRQSVWSFPGNLIMETVATIRRGRNATDRPALSAAVLAEYMPAKEVAEREFLIMRS